MKILIAIYYHPEAYPPTLNAIGVLSTLAQNIFIIYRPHQSNTWKYPDNVALIPSGKVMNGGAQEQSSFLVKARLFVNFCTDIWKTIRKEKPDVLLLYDAIPLLAYRMVRYFTRRKVLIWYHNHDVIEPNTSSKYSISWWAAKWEPKSFQWIDIFSLPSQERAAFFPVATYQGAYFFLPNLPSLTFYDGFTQLEQPQDELRLVYQGSINAEHGLEELLAILSVPILDKKIKLHIIGKSSDHYRTSFLGKAAEYGVQSQVIFEGYIPYSQLPYYTSSNHIGIGINKPQGIIYQTGGTASNKIYEYPACGLPVLYYDIPHYRAHLGQYQWAFATDLTKESLINCLVSIVSRYDEISRRAKTDFQERLNYEKGFKVIAAYLNLNENVRE